MSHPGPCDPWCYWIVFSIQLYAVKFFVRYLTESTVYFSSSNLTKTQQAFFFLINNECIQCYAWFSLVYHNLVHTMHALGQYLMVRIKRLITLLTSIVILVWDGVNRQMLVFLSKLATTRLFWDGKLQKIYRTGKRSLRSWVCV